jgi:hypothetical protein
MAYTTGLIMETPIKPLHELTDEQIREFIEIAATIGARKALRDLGLHDDHAGRDVEELRGLLEAWRSAKKTAWETTIRVITTVFLSALAIGLYFKTK